MRKLKLQVQMSVDGFVAGPKGELDWMTFEKDEKHIQLVNELTDTSSTILLGRNMADDFVKYWEGIVNGQPDSPEYDFARKMVDTPKVVFTHTLVRSRWRNTSLATGDLIEEVNKLKSQEGKDIVVYGGATFVSALIRQNLIDEFNFFINPVILGKGMKIFDLVRERRQLLSLGAIGYSNGVSVLRYMLKR